MEDLIVFYLAITYATNLVIEIFIHKNKLFNEEPNYFKSFLFFISAPVTTPFCFAIAIWRKCNPNP